MIDSRLQPWINAPDAPPPASEESIAAIHAELGFELPADYLALVRQCNGYTGEVDLLGLKFFSVEDLIESSSGYGVNVEKDQVVYFGSNWADTAFAFDFRFDPIQIIETPYGEIDRREFRYYGTTLSEFLTRSHSTSHSTTLRRAASCAGWRLLGASLHPRCSVPPMAGCSRAVMASVQLLIYKRERWKTSFCLTRANWRTTFVC